jgi:tetraacyldisaccharide 4'-kinase
LIAKSQAKPRHLLGVYGQAPRRVEAVHLLEKHWRQFTLVSLLLLPLSMLFAGLSWFRRTAYRSGLLRMFSAPVPVVVIGNLTVGGTGKTPVVIWLAKALTARGFKPGIVSRGYAGSSELSSVGANTLPELVGDEPVLIARRTQCPVWIGRDRAAAVDRLVATNPEVDIIISDDGLQHYRLARDLEVVVIDGQRHFGNGLLLPAGPLREPVSRLKSVDATVFNGGETTELPGRTLTAPAFAMRLSGSTFRNLRNDEINMPAEQLAGLRVHAVAGIGNPERFFAHLRSLGLSFIPHAFPDHHAFTASELDFDNADALLMTEKDAIKCAHFARDTWWALPVDAHIDIALANLVTQRIGALHGH